jgi:CO/xanthine dehydrogenase FAD-binding subunit
MKFADFIIPEGIEEARTALKNLGDTGFPFAGGTAFQYISDRPGITAVDITRLGLKGICREDDTFHIGATTTLTDLTRYQYEGWVLDRIATLIPTHQIRNISTVGGNIARLFPWSELPLGLLVLDADIVVKGDEEHVYSAEEFFAKSPAKFLKPGDLVTEVRVKAIGKGTGFGYKKETMTNSAFSLMTGAATVQLEGDTLSHVRVAAGSALPVPRRLETVEQALEKSSVDPGTIQDAVTRGVSNLAWVGREGMSDDFAAHLAGVILTDVLQAAIQTAREGMGSE